MNKKGLLPVVLVTLVGLAALTVLMLGTMEFVHTTLTGAAARQESGPSEAVFSALPATQDPAYLPRVIVQSSDGQAVLEECVLVPTARQGTTVLECK